METLRTVKLSLLVDTNIKAIRKRLKTTLANIKHQDNRVLWDDLEILNHLIKALKVLEIENDIKKLNQ